ncbi:hypothetical protein KIN34_12940 [Cellulomonas sp. DKR-3]|uniref:DNA-binding protein n=1 Tax=Cellulomonas fulva TaxID=2835530 RepID=A0ABS5U1B0_9CELL|nr:hypothetical protein [Cellulomonas fulva]MBT0995189.1 hypothetical protein [Cellulomonas fulva]
MFILTIDQRGSRRDTDRVPELLRVTQSEWPGIIASSSGSSRDGVVLGFERTVGDEVQGVLDDAGLVVDVALTVLRWGGWSVGIGCGPVDEPLPESSRAASGPGFVLARDAVEAAKSRQRVVPLAVRGAHHDAGLDAEAVLTLAAATAARRSAAGWAAIDAIEQAGPDARQEDVAAQMGVSQQAISQRLRTALWQEELAARRAAAWLLGLAAG